MLDYLVKYGDSNLALYEFRLKNPNRDIPTDLLDRETHKYDLYSRFDQIVFNELSNVVEIGIDNNGGAIDIDWSQIDTSNFTLESTSEPSTA
jgi:hypothetical protein